MKYYSYCGHANVDEANSCEGSDGKSQKKVSDHLQDKPKEGLSLFIDS